MYEKLCVWRGGSKDFTCTCFFFFFCACGPRLVTPRLSFFAVGLHLNWNQCGQDAKSMFWFFFSFCSYFPLHIRFLFIQEAGVCFYRFFIYRNNNGPDRWIHWKDAYTIGSVHLNLLHCVWFSYVVNVRCSNQQIRTPASSVQDSQNLKQLFYFVLFLMNKFLFFIYSYVIIDFKIWATIT